MWIQTIAGTSLAMSLQLIIVAASTTWLVQVITNGLHYLKWGGVVYLLYLGLYHLKEAFGTEKRQIVSLSKPLGNKQ
jgi:threonine/homoserine/homoserine lactone efflux protein